MNPRAYVQKRSARFGASAAAVALLIGGASWHGLASSGVESVAPAVVQAAPAPTVTHAIAGGRDSYADIVEIVSPAVVTVRAEGRARMSETQFALPDDFFGQFFGERGAPRGQRQLPRPRVSAMGSGVVVTGDGYILTNNHVVEDATAIRVDFTDGRSLTAKVVGTDKPSDLALLKVEGTAFKSVTLGDSNAVKVGDVVLAVGNPLNVGQTVTMGIISAKSRSNPAGGVGDGSYEDFLQTDAPINHGNSGGALVNTKGELIGINSQILSNSDGNIGIGFAIPANMARRVMTELRTSGKVTRGQLGVGVQNVTPEIADSLELAQPRGVIVTSVTPGSAADKAGLKVGDVITSLDGQAASDVNTLRNRIADAGPGAAAELVVVRDGAEKRLTARLEQADPAKTAARRSSGGDDDAEPFTNDKHALGVSVTPLTPEIASQLNLPKDASGLAVREVNPEGRAADAGIRAGDVIQQVNRRPVKSVDDLRAAVRTSSDKPALLLINREGANIFVTVKPATNG